MERLNISLGILPYCEKILGLILPIDNVMYVCGYDEVFKIQLDRTAISVEILYEDPYEFADSFTYFLGIDGHKPIYQHNGNTISYRFDSTTDSVKINFSIAGKTGHIKFDISSGDWFAGSF